MAFIRGANVVTDGLVLALDAANSKSYPGSGTTWRDLSGTSVTGSLINGPTFNSANGGSIQFDGVDDFVSVEYNSMFNLSSKPFSIEVSLIENTPSSNLNTFKRIVSWYDGFKNIQVGIGKTNSVGPTRMFYIINGSANANFQTSGDILLNTVYDVVWTFDGTSTYQIYVNGIASTNSPYTANDIVIYNTLGPLYIGQRGDANVTYISGRMFYVRIYNRALSASEVIQNYNATKARFGL